VSLPKRYSIRGFSAAIVEEDNGVMVKYSDYELLRQEFSVLAEERYTTIRALELENERLTKERDHYQWASTNDGIACNERARENQDLENQIADLKAENERMRKAGDALLTCLDYPKAVWPDSVNPRIEAWNAAKETRP
jgi:hypothetical protein